MTALAVIGAGLAGLACARSLQEQGRAVVLFDKGRSAGGRMATRRVETPGGVARFDHGAQEFTVRDPAFAAALAPLAAHVASWAWRGPEAEPRYVGAPGMSALARAFAAGLEVRASTRIEALERSGAAWRLRAQDGGWFGPFDAVAIATPAEQVGDLVAAHSTRLAAQAAEAASAPCWAGLFAYPAPMARPFSARRLEGHPILAWIACDSDKPGRGDDPVCWVAHARPDWSARMLERSPEEVAPLLRAALEEMFEEPPPAAIVAQAHRWRHALVERPAASPCAWDPRLRLGLCGDWRIGPRLEAAWLSGRALAQEMLW